MDANEAIFTRRSIRKYTSQTISDELVKLLIEAGMFAPSARNLQPWHFLVVRDRKTLDELAEIQPNGKMLKHAPLAILICGDISIETMESYLIQNCTAALQNILLSAHANGLGAVWTGVHPKEDRIKGIIDLFNLPEKIVPIALLSIGYPAETVKKPERFNEDKVHYERW
ncbi:MAG: nitroreductase family protein [Saprospiraceae bacterium]|nr:nitroreductase family protein [Saprospiraceae bacterium]